MSTYKYKIRKYIEYDFNKELLEGGTQGSEPVYSTKKVRVKRVIFKIK